MHISVSEAKAQLTELVRRAEAGDDIVLTRYGHPAVRLVAVQERPTRAARIALLQQMREDARGRHDDGISAARSQDFLYGDDGLPG